jgi:L-ectoine synthase
MIVRNLDDIVTSERNVDWGNGNSRRFLIEADGMPYSLTDTIVNAGSKSLLVYKKHLEACYCIEGEGEVKNTCTGKVYEIKPGTMYALDNNEEHVLSAKKEMRLICVFTPPLNGQEKHSLNESEGSSY